METGLVGKLYCPGCEPEADEFVEILTVSWCCQHAPRAEGDADDLTGPRTVALASGGDAEGEDCRAFARLIR